MPIQAPQWTDYLNCPVCCREFGAPPRSPVSLSCGHTLCRHCLKHLHRKQCPFDKTVIHVDTEDLVINTALLQLAGYSPPPQPYHPPCIQALPEIDRHAYDAVVRCFEQLAVYLKHCGNANNNVCGSRLSRPMQRKLVTLLQCAVTDDDGRGKAARAARSLGERTVTELILQHQNPQQLSANLWAAVRARGCQFLGPVMQEEVLKLVLLALEDGSALSRKVLVMFVVQRLEPHFAQASKTSIGHVVQLLYRASCFKVSKRESDSSLMQLKEEFRTYEALRREHDAQIVQIANEAGLRIAPDQWSALLYGATAHKSHMQSIIDKLQTPQSFAQSVQELFIAQQRTGDSAHLVVMSMHLDRLANIDPSPDAPNPSWQQLAEIMTSLREVVSGLVYHMQQQATSRDSNHNAMQMERCPDTTNQLPATPTHCRYKVQMCRDAATRSFCPRGSACTFAHSEDELERFAGARVSSPNSNMLTNSSNYLVPPPTDISLHAQRPSMYPGFTVSQQQPPQMPSYNLTPMTQVQGPVYPDINSNFDAPYVMDRMHTPPPPLGTVGHNNYHVRLSLPGVPLPANGGMPLSMPYMPRFEDPHMHLYRQLPPNYETVNHRAPPPFAVVPPMPHVYMNNTVPSYRMANNSTNRRPDLLPPVTVPNYPPPNIEPVWPPLNNNIFRFDELSMVLPSVSANEDILGPSLTESNNQLADEHELEEELQALERRIDTEFKNTD